MEQNQPAQISPDTNLPEQTQSDVKMQTSPKNFLIPILVILIIFLSATTAFLAYQNWQLTQKISEMEKQTQVPSPSATPDETANQATAGDLANWKTYTDDTYIFKYPPTWKAEAGAKETEEYFGGDVVSIVAPTNNVSIVVTPFQSSYGFGGDVSLERKQLIIQVGGKQYEVTETIVDNRAAFVDLEVQGDKKYHILFGTGYPVNNDDNASLDDYKSQKETIIQILSTFRFLEGAD